MVIFRKLLTAMDSDGTTVIDFKCAVSCSDDFLHPALCGIGGTKTSTDGGDCNLAEKMPLVDAVPSQHGLEVGCKDLMCRSNPSPGMLIFL